MRFRGILRGHPAVMLAIVLVAFVAACASKEQAVRAPSATEEERGERAYEGDGEDEASEQAADGLRREADERRARARTGLEALVASNNQFAFDLLRYVGEGNAVYSPHSVATALAMVEAGAAGQTRQEIRDVLRVASEELVLHPKFRQLHEELKAREAGAKGEDELGFRLRVVNALWAQQGLELEADFQRTLELNYAAPPRPVGFEENPEGARQAINAHVREATVEKIPELLQPGTIGAGTRLVLTNAVYFNAPWKHAFEPAVTKDAPFTTLDGVEKRVPMMGQTRSLRYMATEELQAVELPYVGDQVSMVVLLPAEGRFDAVVDGLSSQRFDWIDGRMRRTRVQVALPRFEARSPWELKQPLSTMGMPAAFGDDADFSPMLVVDEELGLSEIVHEAFISVDEAGTEAAATTAVMIVPSGADLRPPEVFSAERPFLYLIRDRPTGAILFMGRVMDPLDGIR